jgi:carboxylesterase type B
MTENSNLRLPLKHCKKVESEKLQLMIVTSQFDDLCTKFDIHLDTPTSEKLSRLRSIPGQQILATIFKLKTPTFRPTLDDAFISEDIFKYLYSGELADRFRQRDMKLLIGEVEHEEIVYRLSAPTNQAGLLPGLQNYYRSSVAQTLVNHYAKANKDVVEIYTGIVTDLQVRATTRAFSQALVEGGVPGKDILRYRISLPIKGMDKKLEPEQRKEFERKVPHAFDFLHWWYIPSW